MYLEIVLCKLITKTNVNKTVAIDNLTSYANELCSISLYTLQFVYYFEVGILYDWFSMYDRFSM